MIQRKTQTGDYWLESLSFASEDLTQIYDIILDEGAPVQTGSLTLAIMEGHCRREEARIQAEMSRGLAYQPQDEYETGQQVIFPALDFRLGTVVDTRPGNNPEYGEFTVIQVQFDSDGDTREFASQLQGEHRLNRADGEAELFTAGDFRSPPELYAEYGTALDARLEEFLGEHDEFVLFGDQWFLVELLVQIHEGQLNIAEALVEIKAMPLPASELVSELELPAEVSEGVRLLSLNRALEADERFDNVGDSGRDIWYLRRLTPTVVVNPPGRLVAREDRYDRGDIEPELLLIEREIDDEGAGEDVPGPTRPIYRASIALTYPHWRFGTLPLTMGTKGLFPTATTHHSPIVLVDGREGKRMQGWVVHGASFVYGLEEWYSSRKLPAGAIIKLERTRNPRVILVDYEAQRLKRLWLKIASVRSGKLLFQNRKVPISCEFDEHLALGEDDREAIDKLWEDADAGRRSLRRIMIAVMPELVKISPQSTVHAKTIYSAVNVVRRTVPGPVFALLSTEPCFVAMGGGYWTFDETLARP